MMRLSPDRALGRALAIAALVALPAAARAQSNLSVQGFGYPPGQFSTRSEGSAGAIALMDPLSPVNPASIAVVGTRMVYFQIEPEFRTVTVNGVSEGTRVNRYPNVFGAMPIGSRWAVSLGASTLLDRSSSTEFNTTQHLSATDSVLMNTTYQVDGAMNDVRFATAWTPRTWLRVGVGLHAITGHNLVSLTEAFPNDSVDFSRFTQQRMLGFKGSAVSGGVEFVSKYVIAALSGRKGSSLRLSAEDTLITSARVPNQFGASIAYTGIANSAISVRTSRDEWSSLGSLGAPGLKGVDAWDTSVGADLAGPRWSDRILFLRGGFRTRTLPFQAAGQNVRENSISGGMGTDFANSRVLTDFAVTHSTRTASIGASEHAWTLSFGVSVRP